MGLLLPFHASIARVRLLAGLQNIVQLSRGREKDEEVREAGIGTATSEFLSAVAHIRYKYF
jgi:hypothetical protein